MKLDGYEQLVFDFLRCECRECGVDCQSYGVWHYGKDEGLLDDVVTMFEYQRDPGRWFCLNCAFTCKRR